MESEQATPMDSIKDVVQSSVKVPKYDKHLKKAGGHIGRNIVEITIKMKTIVRKPFMIKICMLVTVTQQKVYIWAQFKKEKFCKNLLTFFSTICLQVSEQF